MSEPSIRKIKIPLTPSGQKLPKKTKKRHSETTTTSPNSILCDLARYMQKKYKILATWKGELIELLELCKTRSESKCLLELFAQSKKAVFKSATNEPTTKTTKSTKTSSKKPLFTKKVKRRRSGSNKTQKAVEKENEKDEENTITEIAQRSK